MAADAKLGAARPRSGGAPNLIRTEGLVQQQVIYLGQAMRHIRLLFWGRVPAANERGSYTKNQTLPYSPQPVLLEEHCPRKVFSRGTPRPNDDCAAPISHCALAIHLRANATLHSANATPTRAPEIASRAGSNAFCAGTFPLRADAVAHRAAATAFDNTTMADRAGAHDDCAAFDAHDNSLIHYEMLAIGHRAATTLHGALSTLGCAAGILLRADSIHHENSGIPHRAVARPFRAASIPFRAVRIVVCAAPHAD